MESTSVSEAAGAAVERGNVLYREGNIQAAMVEYETALAIDPRNARAHYNLGVILQELDHLEEATAHYEQVDESSVSYFLARTNLGVISLFRGEYAQGWDGYELRFRTEGVKLAELGKPRLTAENLASARRVAIRKEQGVGDQVLFSTVLPALSALGIGAVVETDPRLVAAYRRSLFGMEFVTKMEAQGAFASCDHECPIGSLAGIFRRDREGFASQPDKLLLPDEARVEWLRRSLPRGSRIAVAWRSFLAGARKPFESRKSPGLAHFAALAGLGAYLIDVQYGDVRDERDAFDRRHPGLRIDPVGLDRFDDLEGVMAVIAACDLVITPSNVTAHLAGALGKRTWLLFPAASPPLHYWAAARGTRSLWYPSVELVTDPAWGDWSEVFEGVAAKLRHERIS